MSFRERDVLKVMALVLKGERTQAEAARLLKRSVRQIRRIARRLEDQGDGGAVHRLRGRPSNRRLDEAIRPRALSLYRASYAGFGPTLAAEKLLADHKLEVARETLRVWLLSEGLWTPSRRRDHHRSRRERRGCFGEMVQADASEHAWLEDRGPMLTLVGMIDDATGRILARFYESETTAAYMDVLGRWVRKHKRPVSWYSDRHGIFRAESRLLGQDEPVSVPTQFSRALSELEIELILAGSPQAKGRIERLWGTLQDRWVKELRLAKVTTMAAANDLLDKRLIGEFNGRFKVKPASANDAHRTGAGYDLPAILSHQEERTVANDYTIQFQGRGYQLLPPVWPGERGGKVIVEKRADGSMRIRFKKRYLAYAAGAAAGVKKVEAPAAARNLVSLTHKPIPAAGAAGRTAKAKDPAIGAGSSAVHRTARRSGRTPALPCPSSGKSCGSGKEAWRPASNHPWRGKEADISIGLR